MLKEKESYIKKGAQRDLHREDIGSDRHTDSQAHTSTKKDAKTYTQR